MFKITAKADYALRATVALAGTAGDPVKGAQLAEAEGIPWRFLELILSELRQAGLVSSRRGSEGGYWLARPAAGITVAEILQAVEGGLSELPDEDAAEPTPLGDLWSHARHTVDELFGSVSLADLAAGAAQGSPTNVAM